MGRATADMSGAERPPDDPFDAEGLPERVATGFAKIGLALRSEAWQQAALRGLTPTQGQILGLLHNRPGGLRLAEVAALLGVTAATASDAVRVLAEKDLVRKRRRAEDARALAVTLTARGRREAARTSGWPDFLSQAVESLPADEQGTLLVALLKVIRGLQEHGRIPVSRMCVTCRFFRPHAHRDALRPHHCLFVDAPFGDRSFRLECVDHQPAAPGDAQEAWRVLEEGTPGHSAGGLTKP
jgi:DNA-binding MarR family transcriptional regulator